MWRLLLILPLALSACGATTPRGPGEGQPLTAGNLPEGESARASDAPAWMFLPGTLRRRGPSSERPDWLPQLPERIERYPVPLEWGSDGLVRREGTDAVFTSAPR